MYAACNAHAPCSNLWPVQLYNIFPHYLINGTILEKQDVIEHKKGVFNFLYNSETLFMQEELSEILV